MSSTRKRAKAAAAVNRNIETNARLRTGLCNDLSDMYKEELLSLARALGLEVTRRHTKADLCAAIEEYSLDTSEPMEVVRPIISTRELLDTRTVRKSPYEIYLGSGQARGLSREQALENWQNNPDIQQRFNNIYDDLTIRYEQYL